MLREFEEARRKDRRRLIVRLAVAVGSAAALYFALGCLSDQLPTGWLQALWWTAFFIVWPGLLFVCEIYFQIVGVREELELQRKQFGALSAELTRRFDVPEGPTPVPEGLNVRGAHQ